MIYVTNSEQETLALGAKIAPLLKKGTLVAFNGFLAAGKSVFCRGIIHHFLPEITVKSPTYTIINEYHTKKGTILHIDAYRLNDSEELLYSGFDLYEDDFFLALIEWSENCEDLIRSYPNVVNITITPHDTTPNKRTIEIKGLEENIAF